MSNAVTVENVYITETSLTSWTALPLLSLTDASPLELIILPLTAKCSTGSKYCSGYLFLLLATTFDGR